ncbi:hypothetical protein DW741_03350 [Ruminococcaceae bacterium AM28-23LB]|nr:hypothetical protein DW741_03350 [Ruminococcaceae bacterium AM28-23LB]
MTGPVESPVTDCRKTYITKRVVRPTPINPQKAATCAWLFALLKGQVCAKGVHTAPCKNSKKGPKPLFRHALTGPGEGPVIFPAEHYAAGIFYILMLFCTVSVPKIE